ncbi:hypothetical protein [Cryptosporangium sp. NPDC051539]|uniref:hypothetical protein n=1 Tax=Cryptosporangium sp. NPDC051539 TaxID=3363962 RepID=UPI0037990E64
MLARGTTRDHSAMAHSPSLPPEVVTRLLAHPAPEVRQAVARRTDLTPAQLAALADDPDLGVRVLLALRQPAPPPRVLLRSYLEYSGAGRAALPHKPGFPTEGLAVYAADPHPPLRLLAAFDPDAGPELLARLSRDGHPDVRVAAARSAGLPPERLVELTADDGERVAATAAANPEFPVAAMRGHYALG